MTFLSLMLVIQTVTTPARGTCPRQPEPALLASAAFAVPPSGETLLFSAKPSFRSVRYALRIVRPSAAGSASGTLIRLSRRFDCNVHDRVGEWTFKLSAVQADAVFRAVPSTEELAEDAKWVTMDGTRVELRRYRAGKPTFSYSSNGPAKENLSKVVLNVVRQHVAANELPSSEDWQYELPEKAF
jgi:hypothetical protein